MGKKKHQPDPKEWLITRHRKGRAHIDACDTGYFGMSAEFHQVHHILPVTCLSDANISKQIDEDPDDLAKIGKCLAVTPWNVNDAHNDIGLPLKAAYHSAAAPAGWNWLPCHQVDHPAYTEEVGIYLKDQIWLEILAQAEKCPDLGKSLKSELESASDHWRGQLKGRGARPIGPASGTEYCWSHRAEPGMEELWYLPFSMAAYPTRRSPPANFAKLAANMQEYLKQIFKKF